MPEETILQTAYFILSGSAVFPSQPYHTILYQWMHILKNQGVPKGHAYAWAGNIENVTLLHPKPSLTGDPLSAPEGWEGRLRTGSAFQDAWSHLLNALSQWGSDTSVTRIVMIIVGPGSGSSVLVGDGELPDSLASIRSNCGNKPVLCVFDFNNSARFVQRSPAKAANSANDGKIGLLYLTSGRYQSQKTAVVLCDDGKIDPAPGIGPDLHYAIYSTMFHRALFQLIVFTSSDPTLAEIAGLLNGDYPFSEGFTAELVSCGSVGETMRLRDFFGGPVDPNALLGILPVRPSGGFIDDVDHFLTDEMRKADCFRLNEFIQVQFADDGTIEVIDSGDWRLTDPLHRAVRLHIECGPSPYPPLSVFFPDNLVLARTLSMVLTDGSGGQSSEQPPERGEADETGGQSSEQPPEPEEAAEYKSDLFEEAYGRRPMSAEAYEVRRQTSRILDGIARFMRRENGSTWIELDSLRPHLHRRTLEGWCQAIRAGQESLQTEESLGNEEVPEVIGECGK
jgi:hypothetical protein